MRYAILFFLLTLPCLSQYKVESVTLITMTGDSDSAKICDVRAGSVITKIIVYSDTLVENLEHAVTLLSQKNDSLQYLNYDIETNETGGAMTNSPNKAVGLFDDYIMLHWVSTGTPVSGRVKVYIEATLVQ